MLMKHPVSNEYWMMSTTKEAKILADATLAWHPLDEGLEDLVCGKNP